MVDATFVVDCIDQHNILKAIDDHRSGDIELFPGYPSLNKLSRARQASPRQAR